MKKEQKKIYFDYPLAKMRSFERIIFRLFTCLIFFLLIGAVISFITSSILRLQFLGAFLIIFLLDIFFFSKKGERPVENLAKAIKSEELVNITKFFYPSALKTFIKAEEKAEILKGAFPLVLAEICLKNKEVQEGLLRMGASLKEMEDKLEEMIEDSKKVAQTKEKIFSEMEVIAIFACEKALAEGSKYVDVAEIFSSLNETKNQDLARLFYLFAVDPEDLKNSLIFGKFRQRFNWLKILPATIGGFVGRPVRIKRRRVNRAWTSFGTPTLDSYSEDFTDLARAERIGFLIGHAHEYDQLVDVLSRSSKPNALLVGEPGSGKESIVARLAYNIVHDNVPEALFDKRLVCLRLGSLISGATPENVSSRANAVIDEVVKAGNIILYIEDIHNLVKTSGVQNMNAADIFLPVIDNNLFPVIGGTYPQEYAKSIGSNSEFAGAFESIRVEEISEDEAVKILTYESIILEKKHRIFISFNAVKESVRLAHKYFRQKLLPSSAGDLLKEAVSDATQKRKKVLQPEDIVFIAERKTKIPIHQAKGDEAETLLNLETIIHERLVDQNEAVSAVSRSLREYRSGLSRKGGPIASFLFVGPTGVGKTELSKILASVQFGSEDMMLRFDMSEFQEKQSLGRFIGSSNGQIAGVLTEAVIQKPFSLVLLDEFEKAHPDILNLFLQVFDDGRLTDNLGRTVDFTNTIIIATSNAHSDFIKTQIEAGISAEKTAVDLKKKLTDYFKPELINRFSNIIVFKPLSTDDIKKIAGFQLNGLRKDVLEAQEIELNFEDSAIQKIAELGFDPVFGARPLREEISKNLRGVLAEKILKKEVVPGDVIMISFEEDKFKFQLVK